MSPRTISRRFLPLLGLLLVLPLTVAAQDDCPEGLICTEYNGHIFEIDPDDGPVLTFVVAEVETTVTTLDGSDTRSEVKLATFVRFADAYVLAAESTHPATGPLEGAEVFTVYGLGEIDSE